MSLLGKKFPAPVGRVMAPFYVSGLVVMYGINSFANLIATSDSFDFKNDPRNPALKNAPAKH
ncbi:F-type H+-transporting ATPase subunit J [Polyplosphaeria fusca]|uniref:F-type H+-transporting ATPase subunit J n=1 Tax=Polyplosphaeria fusca TaxID=682080 RepID=A0A9P4V9B7_9PLEO|nr:F-type H+-transporting ATPase subunit J [Polyplosphaeria fusca]